MNRTIRILARVAALAVLAALLIVWCDSGWWPLASAYGEHNARIDVAHGRYEVLTYGLADQSRSEYATLLHQRYGVELRAVAGCIVSKSLQDYVDAYDRISIEAVNRKFRHDVFKETRDEAEKNWKRAAALKPAN
jgi:hypothetical protein